MKNNITRIILLLCIAFLESTAQKDIRIYSPLIPDYTCGESIEISMRLYNDGSENIDNFVIDFFNNEEKTYSQSFNKSIPAGDYINHSITITPSKPFENSYKITAYTENDTDPSNNSTSNIKSYNLNGDEYILEIPSETSQTPNFQVYVGEEQIIGGGMQFFEDDGTTKSLSFCLPKDTCYEIKVLNLFKTDWCSDGLKDNYEISSDPSTPYKTGDTVYTYFGTFFPSGPYFVKLLNPLTAGEIQNNFFFPDPSTFETITCKKPDNMEAFVKVTNTSEKHVVLYEEYTEGQISYNKEFCSTGPSLVSDQTIKSNLKVFPNPSQGLFFINANQDIKNIRVFDQLGRIVFENSILNSAQINLNSEPTGVYYLNFQAKGENIISKLIIQK